MYYLEIKVSTKESQLPESSAMMKVYIHRSMKQILGEEGCKDKIDILKYDHLSKKIIIRCSKECYVRFRAALVLSNMCEDWSPYSFTINRASRNLLSFRSNSRTYNHGES